MTAPGGIDAPFPIRDVTSWPKTREEQMGSKREVWLVDPATEEDHLFKYVRQDDSGRTYGDDWGREAGRGAGRTAGDSCRGGGPRRPW